MADAKLVDASSTPKSTAVFEMTITEHYSNVNNVMHGGAAAVIFDMCTTSALGPLSKPGYWE
jgi:acyl-coenzyme A thioesterase 13